MDASDVNAKNGFPDAANKDSSGVTYSAPLPIRPSLFLP